MIVNPAQWFELMPGTARTPRNTVQATPEAASRKNGRAGPSELPPLQLATSDTLLVADVQNDFLPGGALAVRRGDEVIAPLNRIIAEFHRLGLPIYATRDWHPTDHCSFRLQGGPWPPHCIAGLRGAEPPSQLHLPPETRLVPKGIVPHAEAYSGFQATGLAVELRRAGCRRVIIGGVATDYCVRATALDALLAGFEAVVLEDAVRPVDVKKGDGRRALEELRAAGAVLTSSDRVIH